MSIQPKPYYSFEDYLAAERQCIDAKHEYMAGQFFAMAGATFNHNLIGTTLASELRQQLKSRPCIALSNAICMPIQTGDACTYPDIVVLCDKPAFHGGRQDVLTDGTLVAVVLLPSTQGLDRGAKFTPYQGLPAGQTLAARSLHRRADPLRVHRLHRPAARGLPKGGVPVCYGYVRPAISASSSEALP